LLGIRKACELNPDALPCAILLGEILCIGRSGNPWHADLDQLMEAEEIFLRCVRDFGQISSEATHKAGKFFCHEVSVICIVTIYYISYTFF